MQQQAHNLRKWLGKKNNNTFRLMSYNILADSLVSESERGNKYFKWENRWPTIFSQVSEYQPDILSLQEMDYDEIHLSEALKNSHYEKLYLKRDNEINADGCALFYQKKNFKLIKTYDLHLQQEHLKVNNTQCMDKPNICLIAVFDNNYNQKPLIVANSHLIFNKNRGDLKLAQIQLILLALQQLQMKYQNSQLIWCGDFNLIPNSALYGYISRGQLDFRNFNPRRISGQHQIHYHPTDYMADRMGLQKRCGQFNQNYEDQSLDYQYDLYTQSLRCQIQNDTLTFHQEQIDSYPIVETPIQLRSVYADTQQSLKQEVQEFYAKWSTYEPLISTMSESQVGCVDYIWINKLSVASILQLPEIKHLIENPIPNQAETSDHLPLICDLY